MTKHRLWLAAAPIALALSGCSTIDSAVRDPAVDSRAEVETTSPEADLNFPTYDRGDIVSEAENFFGQTSAEVAEVIANVFEDQGRPQAYIAGEQVGAAAGVGVTYGKGFLYRPNGAEPVEIYWQGPSIGFDAGADASKVFTLVYDLGATNNLYQRFPGGQGNIYFIGGIGAEAMSTGDVTIVPIRTGIGARAGVNVGYMHFSDDRKWIPF